MKRFMINRLYAAYKALKDPQFSAASGVGASTALHSKVASAYGVAIGTEYLFECYRSDGTLRWRDGFHNLVTDVGMDYILYRLFDAAVAIPAFNTGGREVGIDWGGRRMPRHWTASTAIGLGEYVQPTTTGYSSAQGNFYICGARTGTFKTGASEPTGGSPWPTALGGSVVDNEVTWYRADWYIGLKGAGSAAAGDKASSHSGWTEINTQYSETTRQPFNPSSTTSASSPGRQLNSNAVSTFTFLTGDNPTVIAGAFLSNFPIKGNTTVGALYGNGEFTASRSAYAGDILNVTTQIKFTTSGA